MNIKLMPAITAFLLAGMAMCTALVQAQLAGKGGHSAWRVGDILFQQSTSGQCEAIRLATGSPWTHCGVLVKQEGEWFVCEAVQPVVMTPVDEFIRRGKSRPVAIRRMAAGLSDDQARIITDYALAHVGFNYDLGFRWSDEEYYCSELVWKAYAAAGIELTSARPLNDYDLSSPVVKAIMEKRYGKDIPLQEPMVAPGDLLQSPLLLDPLEINRKR